MPNCLLGTEKASALDAAVASNANRAEVIFIFLSLVREMMCWVDGCWQVAVKTAKGETKRGEQSDLSRSAFCNFNHLCRVPVGLGVLSPVLGAPSIFLIPSYPGPYTETRHTTQKSENTP